MTEMYLLEQLVSFAAHGTLSAAAEDLHITQPALSRSMKKLESEFGVSLFERTGNSLRLNNFGIEAARRAEDILARERDMIHTVREMDRRSRTISIGSVAPMPIVQLQNRLADGRVIASEMNTFDALIQGLENGTYDVISVHHPVQHAGWRCIELFTEHLHAYLPSDHPLAGKPVVRFAELDGETFLANSAIGIWHEIHRRNLPHTHFIEVQREDLQHIRKNSSLLSFVTDWSLRVYEPQPGRVAVPISDADAYMTFYAVMRSDARWLSL